MSLALAMEVGQAPVSAFDPGQQDKAEAAEAPVQFGDRFAEALASDSLAVQQKIAAEIFDDETLQQIGVERLVGMIQRLKGTLDPVEYHHSEVTKFELAPGRIERVLHIYARTKGAQNWKDIQIRLNAAAPYKLKTVSFVAEVAEPVALPNGDITDANTLSWLKEYVAKLARDNDLSGAALVAVDGQIIFEEYFGHADVERSQPVTADTLFNLGSGNKMFTALAIAQLVEQGKLDYSDKLTRWFPDFPHPEWAKSVTVGQLLSHTSGIAEYWTPNNLVVMRRAEHWHELLKLVQQGGFAFEPGTQASYSNSNFILLGAIIEQVAGRDYFDVIDEMIYVPAGMTHSGSFAHADVERPLATPLARDSESKGWKRAAELKRGSPAGGGFSTPREILKYSRALQANKLVSAATLNKITANHTEDLEETFPYGYGFEPQVQGGVASYGHGGITSGVNFEFRYYPGPRVTLVVFSNQDNGAYDDLRRNIQKLITGAR